MVPFGMRYINAIRNMAKMAIGRRLRILILEIWRELDEKCPDEDTRNRGDPANHAADQEFDESRTGKLSGET
jgi:hypothetical protein